MTRKVVAVRRHVQPDATEAHGIVGSIGRPAVGEVFGGSIAVSGWCASPGRRLVKVIAYAAGQRSDIDVNVASEEVPASHPELMGAASCGFCGSLDVPAAGRPQLIHLYAEDQRGHITPFGEILVSGPMPKDDCLEGPVFVVGSPRSGTTILGNTIRYSLGLKGFDEAQFLPLLQDLGRAAKSFYETPYYARQRQITGTMISQVPLTLVESGLAHMFRELYASLHGNGPFVDKTPGPRMLRAIPWLLLAWPNARFVFAMRRAIENLVSRQRKFHFTPKNFETHCGDWAEAMSLWLQYRGAIPENQRIEIDQLDIAKDPRGVAERLAAFCGVEARASSFADFIMSHQPQKTTADDWQVLDISDTGWDEESVTAFQRICGPMMAAWRYTTDNAYRRTSV